MIQSGGAGQMKRGVHMHGIAVEVREQWQLQYAD